MLFVLAPQSHAAENSRGPFESRETSFAHRRYTTLGPMRSHEDMPGSTPESARRYYADVDDATTWMIDQPVNTVHPKTGLGHIHLATLAGQSSAVKGYINLGADPDLLTKRMDSSGLADPPVSGPLWASQEGQTALTLAAEMGKVAVVDALIAGGASLELRNKFDNTPLFMAASGGHEMIVDKLLRAGASVDRRSRGNGDGDHSDTPLTYAAYAGHAGTVRLLLKAGASVEARAEPGGLPALVQALQGAEEHCCHMNKKAGKCRAPPGGRSKGHDDVLAQLIAAGANMNVRLLDGDTPLLAALAYGCPYLVETLLRGGADPNLPSASVDKHLATTHQGCTPLIAAAAYGEVEMARALLDAGASTASRDVNGFTALDWALSHDQKEHTRVKRKAVVELLRSRGATEGGSYEFAREQRREARKADSAANQGYGAVIIACLVGGAALAAWGMLRREAPAQPEERLGRRRMAAQRQQRRVEQNRVRQREEAQAARDRQSARLLRNLQDALSTDALLAAIREVEGLAERTPALDQELERANQRLRALQQAEMAAVNARAQAAAAEARAARGEALAAELLEQAAVAQTDEASVLGSPVAPGADGNHGLCTICLDAPNLHSFVPCGHRSACADCAARILAGPVAQRFCPMCRVACTTSVRVYDAGA